MYKNDFIYTDVGETNIKHFFNLADFGHQGFSLYIDYIDGDTNIPLHSHSFIELVIIFSGNGWHGSSHQKKWFTPGDVFLIPKGEKHYYEDSKHVNMVNIVFDLDILSLPLYDLPQLPGYQLLFGFGQKDRIGYSCLNQAKLIEARHLVDQIAEACQSTQAGMKMIAVSHFMHLLFLLCNNIEKSQDKIATLDYNLGHVVSYMEKNYRENITLDELANIANMSKRNFQRIFKNTFSTSPIDYLLNLRLKKSQIILKRFPKLNIANVAALAGFSDSNYFSKKFKNKFGYSPTKEKKS